MQPQLKIVCLFDLQVFPREDYDALYNMHRQRFKEGGATFYTQTLKVCPHVQSTIDQLQAHVGLA